ncbi:MAG: hypothetical protein NTV73_09650 [Hyphomicrobiales bacterium]|nr:hypothetical protein [Hyphomicrobiales bacterium]
MQLVCLEGGRLRAVFVPDAGAKLLQLIDTRSGQNLLWQNPRVPLARTYPGAPFDDVWCGGWDELFPTDYPCTIDACSYHDHGDLWNGSWEWSLTDDHSTAAASFSRQTSSVPCRVSKTVTLVKDTRKLTFDHCIENLSAAEVRFMWNLHIAHPILAGTRVHLPVSSMAIAGPTSGRLEKNAKRTSWPLASSGLDLSRLPDASANLLEFLCAEDLRDGWCVVAHPSLGLALRLEFDPKVFKTPWLWGVFGGWRGHHFLLTEPCTSLPGSLADAIQNGSAARLGPGESLRTTVSVEILNDFVSDVPGDRDPAVAEIK